MVPKARPRVHPRSGSDNSVRLREPPRGARHPPAPGAPVALLRAVVTLSADEVFLLFEYLLQNSAVRLNKDARPIAFEMLPSTGVVYSFDPRSRRNLFRRTDRR